MPSTEEQKAYMSSMAVKQIEFYFTVENLCKDIFIRSYMDEEGYIPIAFVANFPGVARFGVELGDITAGILASDTLEVDTDNETMRMREGWEVWLLPNQATGKQGVPRYIKVDSAKETATDSEEAATTSGLDPTEPEGSLEQAPPSSQPSEGETADLDERKVDNTDGSLKGDGEKVTERVGKEEQQSISATAPAWTPGGIATDAAEESTSPTPVPPDDTVEGTSANTAS